MIPTTKTPPTPTANSRSIEMPSVRLYPDQIDRLRASGCGAEIIRQAVRRWLAGEVVLSHTSRRKGQKVLQFNLKHVQGVDCATLRAILDAHFATPLPDAAENDREIARLNREIGLYFKELEKQEYILE